MVCIYMYGMDVWSVYGMYIYVVCVYGVYIYVWSGIYGVYICACVVCICMCIYMCDVYVWSKCGVFRCVGCVNIGICVGIWYV